MSHKDRIAYLKEMDDIKATLPDSIRGCPVCRGAGVIARIGLFCMMCTGRGTIPDRKPKLTDRERMEDLK